MTTTTSEGTGSKPTGPLEPARDVSGRQYFRCRVRLRDGSRTRVEIPEAKRYSETASRDFVAWAQERENETGMLYAAKLAGLEKRKARERIQIAKRPDDTCDAWFDAWEESRLARGLTSTRDNRSHYVHHIRPVLQAKHVRA